MQPKVIIFIDSGETIIQELTQVYDENGIILKADFIPGAKETLETLHKNGHKIVLVADGEVSTFENIYRENGLYHIFAARIYSEAIGCEKPSSGMFKAAMGALNLDEKDKNRIVMVGNNLARDIKGANEVGIISVFLQWTTRDIYRKTPNDSTEIPTHTIDTPLELLEPVRALEEKLSKTNP